MARHNVAKGAGLFHQFAALSDTQKHFLATRKDGKWRHNTQYNDIKHNDTQDYGIANNIQHNNTLSLWAKLKC